MKVLLLLLAGISGFCPSALSAQSSDFSLREMNQRMFTAIDGAPTDVYTLAQTPDGTLWIGGRSGLTRFDGMHFVRYPGAGEQELPGTNVSALYADPDGSLWICLRLAGIARLKGGKVTRFGEIEGSPLGVIEQFLRDREGTLWATGRQGLGRLAGSRWERYAGEANIESPYGLLEDRSGALWVAALNGLFVRESGERDFHVFDGTLTFGTGGMPLALSADGAIFAVPHFKLIRIEHPEDRKQRTAVEVRGVSSGPMLIDDSGDLWASEHDNKSLLRASARDIADQASRNPTLHLEQFTTPGGENSARVFALLEDRERNIWVGTTTGLSRFSRGSVARAVAPNCYQFGFIAAAFAPGDNGSLWLACGDYAGSHVDEIRDTGVLNRHASPPFSVAYRDPDGTVWFGGTTALGKVDHGRIEVMPLPTQLQGRPIAALVRESSGALWVSITRRGLYRFADGKWVESGGLEGLPPGWPIVATADANGVLWFGYPENGIVRVEDGNVKLLGVKQGLAVGNVLSILAQDGEIWVGGELGLARLEGSRFVSMRSESGTPFRGISGIVRAANGDLWLNGVDAIVRVAGDEIEAVVRQPAHLLKCEIFNYLDGVPGTAVQVRPQPSAIQTTDGRIWFSRTAGIVTIDAARLVRNTLPPPVTIWSLTSGLKRYPNLGESLKLPMHTTNLQIEYSAGSLTVPERVHFRYKLEGSDSNWQDVGTRREAHYTNLGPGQYRFRVIASNNDGVWNDKGASFAFTIPPAFYQTNWFHALCVLACLGALTAAYRVRVRQVAAQVRSRLEARLAERERIARDLHDTLLQGIQGLIWQFQAATDRIPPGEPARHLMEKSLDRADQLLGESRDRVKDLRPATSEVTDLAQALANEGEHHASLHRAKFRVSVQGVARDLHPIVREEILFIGREAMGNAFRHAGADNIEAEITFGHAALQLSIRDDGQGISAALLDAGGRPGHFGLIGMRERAQKLGGQLEIWSRPGAGTGIDLRVPARVAYTRTYRASRNVRSWFAARAKK
jgi:signal transduction histidine kinase/ligand-binding sensor domain-containing protein